MIDQRRRKAPTLTCPVLVKVALDFFYVCFCRSGAMAGARLAERLGEQLRLAVKIFLERVYRMWRACDM